MYTRAAVKRVLYNGVAAGQGRRPRRVRFLFLMAVRDSLTPHAPGPCAPPSAVSRSRSDADRNARITPQSRVRRERMRRKTKKSRYKTDREKREKLRARPGINPAPAPAVFDTTCRPEPRNRPTSLPGRFNTDPLMTRTVPLRQTCYYFNVFVTQSDRSRCGFTTTYVHLLFVHHLYILFLLEIFIRSLYTPHTVSGSEFRLKSIL